MSKKFLQKKFSKKTEKLFDEASQGDTKAMITLLVKSGRVTCSRKDLKDFLDTFLPA